MVKSKQVTFSIEPAFESANRIRRRTKAACTGWFTKSGAETVIDDFCQIISELVNNAVEHGNCTQMHGKLTLMAEEALFTLITDGTPFDPFLFPAQMPGVSSNAELPEGGFGLAIIQKLADKKSYEFKEGLNIISVGKHFNAFRG